jgi:hypothetical protein
MQQENITGFKAVNPTSSDAGPLSYIDPEVKLLSSHTVSGNRSEYITQIKEKQGLHSCLPTSTLNGLLHLGLISHQQAEAFQATFHTENSDLFTTRQFGDELLTVMAVSTSLLLDRLKKKLGYELNSKVIGVEGLQTEELLTLIKQELSKEKVIVADYNKHALLIIGYDDNTGQLNIVDPYFPSQKSHRDATLFAHSILSGEPWITVLTK